MKTLQKLNRRSYGNRPFKSYINMSRASQLMSSLENGDIIKPKKLSWFRRFINFIKNLI